jgi:GMP synthase-like glutamine amidotransferase
MKLGFSSPAPLRVAILSMYNNVPNQGMRSIKAILERESGRFNQTPITYQVYETRFLNELPDIESFDAIISTGGPGDPFDGLGQAWEKNYFQLLDQIQANNSKADSPKKFVFSICHSFQLMCRYFEIATVNRRMKTSFGVFPCHFTADGLNEPIFEGLHDPFYIVDSREWQCVEPDFEKLKALGASILSLEKFRPHVKLEQALMSIRISPYWVGTQFHPEADPEGMRIYFAEEDRKQGAIAQHGEEKFRNMIDNLENPEHLWKTNHSILPNFLRQAVESLKHQFALV